MQTTNSRTLGIVLLVMCGLVLVFWMGYCASMRVMRYEEVAGFRLPPGDALAGEHAFHELGCAQCHSVSGSTVYRRPADASELHVVLGGPVHVVKTYGELVTAIIHPDESIRPDVLRKMAEEDPHTPMPDLTRKMTTRQMIDLVTYLQAQYKVQLPEYPRNYYPYGMEGLDH
jgi:sulfur-oxidizing protein SoxX